MPNCRGTFYSALRVFLRERFGPQAWEELLDCLEPQDRADADSAVSIAWTDLYLRMRVAAVVVRKFGARLLGDDLADDDERVWESGKALLMEFGRFEAEKDLTTTQRVFLRMANPAYVLEKAGQYWSRFYDWGGLRIERKSKTHAIATLLDSAVVDELFCIHFCAYVKRMFELVGAKDVQVEHLECLAQGDSACVYDVQWS